METSSAAGMAAVQSAGAQLTAARAATTESIIDLVAGVSGMKHWIETRL